jgi:hypothetical protein
MTNSASPVSEHPAPTTPPGQDWFDIIRRPTLEAFASAFAAHASMDGAVLAQPVIGAAGIREVFDATRRMYDAISFKSELTTPTRTYLEWEGVFHGSPVAGVTVLSKDASGLIEHVRLYHRPFSQVLAFSNELRRLLSPA